MAQGFEVLQMLIPNGGWVITGNNYEDIQFIEADPISKKEFEDGFAAFDLWKNQKEIAANEARAALLARLGITEDEAKLLLG